MSSQITKRLICLWKGCDELVFEEAAAFKMHVDKHIHEQMQMDNQKNDGTEEQQEDDEPVRKKAKLNEDKMASGAGNGEREIICMAIEVWTDVFGFVKRIQLARTICLTNRHIHRICCPRLHGNKVEAFQSREITIVGRERYDRDRPPKALVLKDGKAMPIPSCPVPPYISGFYCIKIEFLDQQVLAFFAHIIPCLAKSGVKLLLCSNSNKSDAKQHALLDQLLNILEDGLPKNKLYSHVPNIHSPYLLDMYNKMEQIILSLNDYTDIPVLMKILASPRPDGQQRVIYVPSQVRYLTWVMLKDIKEDFHSSIQRLSQPFYIRFYPSPRHSVQSSVETNELTNEQLTIMPTVNHSYLWDICRHPRGQYEQWAEDGRNRVKSASENERLTAINVALENFLMILFNINRCGWQQFRHMFNAIIGGGGHPSFCTITAAGTLNYATLLDTSFECGCIQRISSPHFQLQLRHFNQTAISSQSFPQTEAIDNEQSQQQAKSSPEHVEEEQQNGTDSSATTISSKTEEENANAQQNREEQQQQLNEKQQQKKKQLKTGRPQYLELAKNSTLVGPNRILEVRCKQGSSGQKIFCIQIFEFDLKLPNITHFYLPNMLVPQEAYKFVEAIDLLISLLPAEKPTNPEDDYEYNKTQPILATHSQMVVRGKYYDFKLSTVFDQRSGQWNLEMRSVRTVQEHKEQCVHIPLSTVPWLRHHLVTILAKHDGIQMGKPPSIPAWAKRAKEMRTSPSPSVEQNNQPNSSPMNSAQNLAAQLQQQQAQLAGIEKMLRQTQFLLANIVQQQSSAPPHQMGKQQQSPQQQQLAQIQAQIARLTGAMNFPSPNYHQSPYGFTVPPASALSPISSSTSGTTTATNAFQSAHPPNPAFHQSTTGAAAAALVAQLIDQLKKANSMGTVKTADAAKKSEK